MDIERNSYGSRRSHHNNTDRASLKSVMSLQRLSEQRRSSLSKKVSLIDAMDIEVSNNSVYGRHDDLLINEDSKRFSDFRRSSNKSKEPYEYKADIHQKDLNRKSHYKIKHECTCNESECLQHHCICYLTPREICIIGQCCPRCIAIKNEYLQATRGFTLNREKKQKELSKEENALLHIIKQKNSKNMHYFKQIYGNEPCMKDLVFCTCKKSHCQKKYCLCFQKGVKCGEFCICIECENKEEEEDEFREEEQRRWERYAIYKPYDENEDKEHEHIDSDIEQFIEDQNKGEFNEIMEFQPVDFANALSDNACG